MKHTSCLFLLLGLAAAAQSKPPHALKVRFADGAVLTIRTASTGAHAPLSTSGVETVPEGSSFHRAAVDKDGKILIIYEIQARRAGEGSIAVEIKPIPVRFLSLHSQVRPDKLPTLSAARSYPDLRPGDAVEVDILQNPATGERIYDVLTAGLETPSAADGRRAPGERLSLEDARMAVNGKTVVERQESRQTWMRCGALMIHLPGRGEFYFSLTPPAGLPFRPAAWVDRATLRFHAGPDLVEVTGRSNILPRSLFATLWMHHISSTPDRGYEFHCGDDAQSVIELYRKKDD